jgi:hypothetical protein
MSTPRDWRKPKMHDGAKYFGVMLVVCQKRVSSMFYPEMPRRGGRDRGRANRNKVAPNPSNGFLAPLRESHSRNQWASRKCNVMRVAGAMYDS